MTLTMRDVVLRGELRKVKLSKSISFSSERRHLVIMGDYLLGFKKEPTKFSYSDIETGEDISVDFSNDTDVRHKAVQPYLVMFIGNLRYVRTYDASESCTVFEMRMDGFQSKVYAFECADHLETRRWVRVIDAIKRRTLSEHAKKDDMDMRSEVPDYILVYSEHGKPGCASMMRENLGHLFPEIPGDSVGDNPVSPRGSGDSSPRPLSKAISKAITGGNALMTYFDTCIDECILLTMTLDSSDAGARGRGGHSSSSLLNLSADVVYAALCVVITEINSILSSRFASVMYPNSASPGQAQGAPKSFTKLSSRTLSPHLNARGGLRDLHSLIAWITKYQQKVKSVYCPVDVPTHLHCDLFEMLPSLFSRYVNGEGGTDDSVGDTADGAANLLKEHVMKVWGTVVGDMTTYDPENHSSGGNNTGEGALIKDTEGTFHTQAPTAVWAALKLHLDLAQEAQSAVLQVMIVSKIASAMDALTVEMCRFFGASDSSGDTFESLLGRGGEGGLSKEHELEWVCAVVNDCGSHVDEILDIMHNFKHIYEVAAHVSAVFQPVMARLLSLGRIALQRLVNIVLSDLSGHYDSIFTPDWSQENSVRTAVKTIMLTASDYLADFKVCLVQFWYERCRKLVLDALCDEYVRSVLRRVSHISGTRGRSSSIIGSILSAATVTPVRAGEVSLSSVLDGLGTPVGPCATLDIAASKALEADLQTFQSEIVALWTSPECGSSTGPGMAMFGDMVIQNNPGTGLNSSGNPSSDKQQAVLSAAADHMSLCTSFVAALREAAKSAVLNVNELLRWHAEHVEVTMKKEADKAAKLAKQSGGGPSSGVNFNTEQEGISALQAKERVDNTATAKVYLRAILSIKGLSDSEQDALITSVAQPSGSDINIAKVNMDPVVDEQRRSSSTTLHRLATLLNISNTSAQSPEEKAVQIALIKRDARAAAVSENNVRNGASTSTKGGTVLARDVQSAPEGAFLRREGPQSSALRRNSSSKRNLANAIDAAESLRASVTSPDENVLASIASHEEENARNIQNETADSMKQQERLRQKNTRDYHAEGELSKRDVDMAPGGGSGPKCGQWHGLYGKINSRAFDDGTTEGGLAHSLIFLTKSGGTATGAPIDLTKVTSLILLATPRALSYSPDTDKVVLLTDNDEALAGVEISPAANNVDRGSSTSSGSSDHHYILRLAQATANVGHDLKFNDVDSLIDWTNTLSSSAGFSYAMTVNSLSGDKGLTHSGEWTRLARQRLPATAAAWKDMKKQEEKEKAAGQLISSIKGHRGAPPPPPSTGASSLASSGGGTLSAGHALMRKKENKLGVSAKDKGKDGGTAGNKQLARRLTVTTSAPDLHSLTDESISSPLAEEQASSQSTSHRPPPPPPPGAVQGSAPTKRLSLMDPRKIESSNSARSPLHEGGVSPRSLIQSSSASELTRDTTPPAPPNGGHYSKSVTQSPHTTRRKSIGALNADGSPAASRSVSNESFFDETSQSGRKQPRPLARKLEGLTEGSRSSRSRLNNKKINKDDDDDDDDDWGKSQLSRTNVPFSDSTSGDETPPPPPPGDHTGAKRPPDVPPLDIERELFEQEPVGAGRAGDPYVEMASSSGRSYSTSSPASSAYNSAKEGNLSTPSPQLTPRGKRSSLKIVSSFEEPGSTTTTPHSSGKVTSDSAEGSPKKRVNFKKSECLEYDISSPPAITLVENGGRFRTKSNIPLEVSLKGVSNMPDVYPDDYVEGGKRKKANRPLGCCPIV